MPRTPADFFHQPPTYHYQNINLYTFNLKLFILGGCLRRLIAGRKIHHTPPNSSSGRLFIATESSQLYGTAVSQARHTKVCRTALFLR